MCHFQELISRGLKIILFLFYFFFLIAVRGEWTPVVMLAEQCDYTIDNQDAHIVISAPYITCGITIKVNSTEDRKHQNTCLFVVDAQIFIGVQH